MACQWPAETGLPLSRWSGPELADEIVARGIAWAISSSTVRRILAADALKPWQHQSWIFIRPPTSPPGPPRCSACTPASSAVSRSVPTST